MKTHQKDMVTLNTYTSRNGAPKLDRLVPTAPLVLAGESIFKRRLPELGPFGEGEMVLTRQKLLFHKKQCKWRIPSEGWTGCSGRYPM